jgi:S-adenosylmethionine-diacylglycerol 3-amino-3-carboxypropyl transferase
VRQVYEQKLRRELSPFAQAYWDRCIRFFDNPRKPFYYRGTTGFFARFMRIYADRVMRVKPQIEEILSVRSLEKQRAIYYEYIRPRLWTRLIRTAMNRDTTMSLLGVPRQQRMQIDTQYEGGLVKFIQDCVDTVFGQLPLWDNYFWRVYITGQYSRDCCPEYLKEENFQRLRDGQVDRISTHTDSVQGFLDKHPGRISRFVLLDHMDWLSDRFFPLLEAEWQSIVDRATPDARLIWRSGGLRTDFLERVQVLVGGKMRVVTDMLSLNEQLAAELHARDRVHTYGSFYIADLAA